MTQKEKELLLKDLCARLPYGVILQLTIWDDEMGNARLTGIDEDGNLTADVPAYCTFNIEDVKPYLRPMSSMTEEEREYMEELSSLRCTPNIAIQKIDFYLKNHFDYRGLIKKGLAIETPEEMYKN